MNKPSREAPKTAAKRSDVEPGDGQRSWWRSHSLTFGGAVAVALFGGGMWWRRRRRRRIQLTPVSESWLQQHEYESGQREQE
jgi:hypothetical protein